MRPVRRSALISPWGVGAIVPFPNDESLMIAGLDMWRYQDKNDFIIKDERLTRRLGVKELRWPPDYRERNTDPKNCYIKIPAVRFPRWHYCPYCGEMKKASLYGSPVFCSSIQWTTGNKCRPNDSHPRRMIPERFIAVCEAGHIEDFPVAEWVHYSTGHSYNPQSCTIRRSTGGTSAALTGVKYECTCGARKSLAGALNKGALTRVGCSCKGSMPWLGVEDSSDTSHCDKELHVLQRGATNVWFANTVSSIHIPIDNEKTTKHILDVVDKWFDTISGSRVNGELPKDMIKLLAMKFNVEENALIQAFQDRLENKKTLTEVNENTSEDEFRWGEYEMLIQSSGSDAMDFHSINNPITIYNSIIHPFFKSVSLVERLRETRAFLGFSRLKPSGNNEIDKLKSMLRLGNGNWLPAVEVYGEGVFFEFDKIKLKTWANLPQVKERVAVLNKSYSASSFAKERRGDLRPEYVLLHTFSHLVINQLSYECGYGSSSIKERIYCERDDDKLQMCGVLVYTASGDSDGSMGGLVRQGTPGRLEDMIITAIRNASWCSSDPICIDSVGQGPESLNLAACHNCTLLPETCCEVGNRLLDRGLLVGTMNDYSIGYFNSLLI